ncbi:MAG: thermonuclease family protein [Methyloceanibacter sp.]
MSRVVHPEFEHGRRYVPPRPNILRRVISRYQLVELTVIIGAIFLLWGGSSIARLPSMMNAAQPLAWLESFRVEIIDGDSIRSGGDVYRLVGFNTPEGGANAGCQRERALSQAAKERLSQLVADGQIDLRRVPCACPSGTEGTGQCNYGRYCATLSVRGRDVGTTLIGEGLAEPYVCSKTACPPRKDWCRS